MCDEDGNPFEADTASARTALPALTTSNFSSFSLDGSTDGGFEWQSLWNSDASSSVSALSQLNSASVAVEEGHWNFRLTAQKGGAKYTGYHARTEIVAAQANTLSFTLTLSSLGADSANSTGSVKVSVNYPASGVSKVTAGLRTLLGVAVSGFGETDATTSGSGTTKTATYEKSGIPAGTYAVVFRFYADSAKEILLGTWTEYAGIASGVQSVSDDMEKNTIDSLDSTYTITYNWNGGGLSSGTAQGSYSRHNAVALPTASQVAKTGYTFKGWYDNSALTGTAITEIPANTTGAKSFWAKWQANTYTVRYHRNMSESDTATYTQTLTYDAEESLKTLATLGWTRSDATFKGWETSASSATASITRDGKRDTHNLTAENGATVDLYAVWQYTVTLNANGGSGGTSEVTVVYGVNSATITPPTRTNYTFLGYYDTNADSGGTQYFKADGTSARSWNKTANTTLYARWKLAAFTVSFNTGGGSSVASQTVIVNNMATLPPSDPTRTGYTFLGWYADSAKTTAFDFSTRITANTTIYAKWRAITYSIAYYYYTDWADSYTPTYSYTAEDTVTLPTASNMTTYTGYTFGGWYDNEDFTGTAVTQIASGSTGDKIFYAKWTANTYKVTLDRNGGSGGTASVTATFHSAMPSITVPTNGDYIFVGYYDTSAKTGGTQYFKADGTSARIWNKTVDTTLYARWKANTAVYVSSSGSDSTGDGTSAKPYATIAQAVAAIDGANNATADWTIYVSGTITGGTTINSVSAKSLTIEKASSASNAILDGNKEDCVLRLLCSEPTPITLKNLTIRNGAYTYGGGIWVGCSGNVTITGCTIKNCTANDVGGGIYVSSPCSVLINGNTTITNCKTTSSSTYTGGGGICIDSVGASVTIDNGKITECTAGRNGGGVYIAARSTLTLISGQIGGNTAENNGGGVEISSNATFEMTGGSVTNNQALKGGGVYLYSSSSQFIMSGGTITSDNNSFSVYNPNNGTVTHNGGEISGSTFGL